jgi:glycosyltransferase involved in cell wall biosynthesis
MNIVMLMSVYGDRAVGGAERTAAQMAKLLVAKGHKVHIVSLSAKGKAAPAARLDDGVVCESIPLRQWYDPYSEQATTSTHRQRYFSRLYRWWEAIRKACWHVLDIYNPFMVAAVRQKLVQLRPDILFTHTLQGFSVGVWAAARGLDIKVVHMAHDHALICPGTAMTRGTKVCERICGSCVFFNAARQWVAVAPDAVVGPSEIVLERHRRFGWFTQVIQHQVIPNALPTHWQSMEPSAQRPVSEFRLHHPMKLGFLGRIDESKGADTLIMALALLPEHVLGRWRLFVGGQGSMQQLQNWVLTMPNGSDRWSLISPYVAYLGLVKADDFLKKLDVLVTPSRAHETFCNVVMEAASLACPAIVSDKGALPERVDHGLSGWIFPAGQAAALSGHIERLLEQPHQVQQKALAALKSRHRYAPHLQIERVERLLNSVLND